MRCSSAVVSLAACLVFSCQPFVPTEPGVREFTPDAALHAAFVPLWSAVEACAGVTRPMADIRWFMIPGARDFAHDGRVIAGYYRPPNQIVMGEEGYYFDTWVAHEMLHAILRDTNHPPVFLGACATLVSPP